MRGASRWAAVVATTSLLSFTIGGALAAPAGAQSRRPALTCSISWTHLGSGLWTSATNWSPARVPLSTDIACITAPGSYTVTLNGSATIRSLLVGGASGTQTLKVQGAFAGSASLTETSGAEIGLHGVLTLDSTDANSATLAGDDVKNAGVFQTIQDGGGTRYIHAPLDNGGGGIMTFAATNNVQDAGTTDTDNGTVTVAAGATLGLSAASGFSDQLGTLTVNGALSVAGGGTFTQSGGTEAGNPVTLNGSTLADSVGTGTFHLEGADTLTGTIPAGQTVTVFGSGGTAETTMNSGVTNNGTLALDSTDGSTAILDGTGTLTNNGTLSVAATAAGPRDLRVNLDNTATGTVTVASSDVAQDAGTTTTNEGEFTVLPGSSIDLGDDSNFTNTAGTLSVGASASPGFLQEGGTFTESGGTEDGNPVVLSDATFIDSAGDGTFVLVANDTLTGTIPSGQGVTVFESSSTPAAETTLSAGITNNGALAVEEDGSDPAILDGTGTLTNNGTLSLVGKGSFGASLRVKLVNSVTGRVDVTGDVADYEGRTITNNGFLEVGEENGAFGVSSSELELGPTTTFTNGAKATFGSTLMYGIVGGTVKLAGTLQIAAQATPPVGFMFQPILNAVVTGTFSTFDFGPQAYSVAYSPSAVTLTTVAPFTLKARTLPAVPAGTLTKLTLATVTNSPPSVTYSVSVNWGDGTTSAGTFKATSTGGAAKGKHTWTTAGNYTVQTTVRSSNGTTLTVSKGIVITAPS